MADVKDMDLVRQYADDNSEPAFAELVRRHINMVYSVAMRFTGNETDAKDVTQAVFIVLAQKAAKIGPATILTGWLYETARFTGMNLLRTRARQQAREQEAYMQSTLNEAHPDDAWKQLEPLLEEAMSRLNEKERTLLALRFFENRSGAEAAAALGLQEWAARKRVERAVEKLRKFFIRRGIALPGEVMTGTISAHSVQTAPVALAKIVTAAAIAKGAAAGGSTLTLINGALKLMAWSKAKTAVVTAAVVLLTGGGTLVTMKAIHSLRYQPGIQGAWEGEIGTAVGKLRVVLHVTGAKGSYHASIDSIDQRSKGIPIDKFDYDYPSLKFASKAVDGTFDGSLNPGADTMSGTWKQPSLDTKVVMKRTATPAAIPDILTESDYTPRAGSDLQGLWNGTLQAGTTLLHVAFKISEPETGMYVAELDSKDQHVNDIIVSSVTYDKPAVHLEVGAIGGVFEGKFNSDLTEITGTWTQGGTAIPLKVTRADLNAEHALAAAKDVNKDFSHNGPNDLTGHWKGALDVQGMKLHLALHVAKLPNGKLSGSLDSLDQGANDIPADKVKFTSPNVHMEWQMIAGSYDGKVKNDKISGTWRQAGKSFPLVFARSTE